MRSTPLLLAALAGLAHAASLEDVCTRSHAASALPLDAYPGITIDPSSVTAAATYNLSVTSVMYPNATIDYCNVTFAYTHDGRNDRVLVQYWLPAPSKFENRFLTTGGGGLAINSGNRDLPGGIMYGAAAGLTDGGFGGFNNQWNTAFLLANNTINWEALFMFGYHGIHEMTVLGQQFTQNFFDMGDTRLYRYYQGCSEGGREGWSQIQRFTTFDGAITGAPAFRYAQQQVQHLYSNVVEQDEDYYPPPCELQRISNATVAFCDPLDGKTDGVVARTDLCRQRFDYNSTIGLSYSCPATPASRFGPASPAQNGTVSATAARIAEKITAGLHTSDGKLAYFSYEPSAATFYDAATAYNPSSQKWELSQSPLGGEWVARYLLLQNATLAPDFENVTLDTLVSWMELGLERYYDVLQTTWPDLTRYHESGGKVLHYHGDADDSIPTASSVRYHDSVRKTMYPHLDYAASNAELNKWYKLYIVPGAAHCTTNSYQPNAPYPQTNLAVMIDWVEKGIEPVKLNATVLLGSNQGKNEQVCQWPLRPFWKKGVMECVNDARSLGEWQYELDAFKFPIY